ncbi:MAG: hypothetical protein JWQ01_4598 [Massilia sp.]|nr:hypothetical protein [Massilia sp.]
MPTVEKLLLGSQATLLTTELNTLANNGTAISTVLGGTGVYDNTIGQAGDGYTLCDVELVVTYGVAPTANTGVSFWFLLAEDGANYEDGDASTTPGRLPDIVFPLRAVTTAQRITRRAMMPWGKWKSLAKNDGTGQAMAASGNTIKIRPVTPEGV